MLIMKKCKHGLDPFTESCLDCVKDTLHNLTKALQSTEKFCPFPECLVQYFKHYHLDRHILTFREPENIKDENIQR